MLLFSSAAQLLRTAGIACPYLCQSRHDLNVAVRSDPYCFGGIFTRLCAIAQLRLAQRRLGLVKGRCSADIVAPRRFESRSRSRALASRPYHASEYSACEASSPSSDPGLSEPMARCCTSAWLRISHQEGQLVTGQVIRLQLAFLRLPEDGLRLLHPIEVVVILAKVEVVTHAVRISPQGLTKFLKRLSILAEG